MRAKRAAEELWKDVGGWWRNMQRALVPPAELVTLISDEGATDKSRNLAISLVAETRALLGDAGLSRVLATEMGKLFKGIFNAIDERDDEKLERALYKYTCFLWKVYLRWLNRDFAERNSEHAEPIKLVLSEFSNDSDWEMWIRRVLRELIGMAGIDGVRLGYVEIAEKELERAKKSGEVGPRTFRYAMGFLGLVNSYNKLVLEIENPCGSKLRKLSKRLENIWDMMVDTLGDMIDAYNDEV